jgi:dCMP deaminase
MLVNARIKRFVTFGKYADNSFIDLFNEAGIEFELRDRPAAKITYLD